MQCVNCYEKEHGKTLWTFRQNLSYYEKVEEDNNQEIEIDPSNALNESTFNKTDFIQNLKIYWAWWGLTMAIRGSAVSLKWNICTITTTSNFAKINIEKFDNTILIQNTFSKLWIDDVSVEVYLKDKLETKVEPKIITSKCPNCSSSNIKSKWIRRDKKRLLCWECWKNWSVLLEDYEDDVVKKPIKKEEEFERENTIEEIKDYLKIKESSNSPVSFYYRDKENTDTYNDYYFDDTYLHVKNWNSKYYIKYLIEKIRKVV